MKYHCTYWLAEEVLRIDEILWSSMQLIVFLGSKLERDYFAFGSRNLANRVHNIPPAKLRLASLFGMFSFVCATDHA